ncbi:MAG: hypothetical protein COC09_03940 [Gammaproteobacteria bacterium]|nr:hypothetical protein [Gammaproteobacteria bacterium]PCH64077.1 MAG: hypothetical protein COC09_03940 [Gammaproteobacteria bacterium]
MTDSAACHNTKRITYSLKRRGYDLGTVHSGDEGEGSISSDDELSNWQQGKPFLLKKICLPQLAEYSEHINQAYSLYQAILNDEECDPIFAESPYRDRLDHGFESLGSSVNEGDDQEIETVLFDAIEKGETLAEDLWMKISWLSFHEEDASLRFRFSFGVDNIEDVAADKQRQHYAALLTDAVFPESRLITDNTDLSHHIQKAMVSDTVKFVERIVYFNSPGGGAYLHHDRERGHAGVVYAQLSGITYWLALPKQLLMQEIALFVKQCHQTNAWPKTLDSTMQDELKQLAKNQQDLSSELESFSNNTLIHLINETKQFVQQLITNGHGRLVQSGDALLLPQETDLSCCWHSVFSLGEESGEALSFAVRGG